jgi:hypothetical protein
VLAGLPQWPHLALSGAATLLYYPGQHLAAAAAAGSAAQRTPVPRVTPVGMFLVVAVCHLPVDSTAGAWGRERHGEVRSARGHGARGARRQGTTVAGAAAAGCAAALG